MINMQNGTFTLQLNHHYRASKDRVFQAWTNTHENFSTKEQAENHTKGWNSSLESNLMRYLEQSA